MRTPILAPGTCWGFRRKNKSRSFVSASKERLSSFPGAADSAQSDTQKTVRRKAWIPPLVSPACWEGSEHRSPSSPSPARFHSGFPGSAWLLGAIGSLTKTWFFCKHLDCSCLMYRLKNKRPPSGTPSSHSNTRRPLEDIPNHTVGRITAGGGEPMEINQRSAPFAPPALHPPQFDH